MATPEAPGTTASADDSGRQADLALVFALWGLALMGLMAAAFLSGMRTKMRVIANISTAPTRNASRGSFPPSVSRPSAHGTLPARSRTSETATVSPGAAGPTRRPTLRRATACKPPVQRRRRAGRGRQDRARSRRAARAACDRRPLRPRRRSAGGDPPRAAGAAGRERGRGGRLSRRSRRRQRFRASPRASTPLGS